MRGSSCEAGKDLEYSQASHWAASLGDTVPLFSLSVRNMELLNENFRKNLLFYQCVDILTNNHIMYRVQVKSIRSLLGRTLSNSFILNPVILFFCQGQVSNWIINIDI